MIKICKSKIFTKMLAYAKLAIHLYKDGSWQKSNQIEDQFTELIKPLIAMNKYAVDSRDYSSKSLQTITQNWDVLATESLKNEITGTTYLRHIVQVSTIYKDQYLDVYQELNYCIIIYIFSQKDHQSSCRYSFFIDQIKVLNTSN